MKSRHFRGDLLVGVSKIVLGTLALVSLQGQAQGSSICSADGLQTFSCVDETSIPAMTGTGTFSAGAEFMAGPNGRLQIASTGALDVTLNGQINSTNVSNQYLTSAVYLTATGVLNYTINGTTTGSTTGWLFNTYLRSGEAIVASTGTVIADGYRVTGVYSETLNGNNTLTGGTTNVSGVGARGLWSDAYAGNNVTNTGTVTASGYGSRGVVARALPSLGRCSGVPSGQSTTVNVTGNVSAEYAAITTLTCGDSTVNVQSGTTVSVTGTDSVAILNIGNTATTNIDGSVLAASVSQTALDIRDGSSITTIGSSGVMSGTFDGDINTDSITIASGGVWTSAGTSDFGDGSDLVSNNGTMNVDAGTFTNLETFTNDGVLALSGGSFTITGATDFTNNGTIRVVQGATTITSDSALSNNGVIDMQNGFAGDVVTITNNYVAGTNAAIMIDVSGPTSDMFVVNGTSGSGMRALSESPSQGSTRIFINAPALINTNAVLIGTTQPGMNFVVGNQATRLIDLKLEQAKSGVYLVALPNAFAFQPLLVGQVVRDNWYQSAGVYSANAAMLRGDLSAKRRRSVGLWGQLYAGEDRYGDRSSQTVFGTDVDIDNRVRTKRTGAQLGFDASFGNSVVAGLTGGYQKAKASHRSLEGGVDSDGYNIGAFALFGRPAGVYGSLLVKYDWSDAELTNSAFDASSGDPDFSSFGGEVGVGYRWSIDAVRFDLGASLSHVRTSVDSFSAEGINYDFNSIKSVRGSLDARAEFGNGDIVPFVNARLLREFDGQSELTLASGDEADQVRTNGKRTWARFEAGVTGRGVSGPLLSGWAEVGDVQGFGVRGGWRF